MRKSGRYDKYTGFVYYWELFYSSIVFLSIGARHMQGLLYKF
jgi:hypothetical protein